jgi:hypothetical protein
MRKKKRKESEKKGRKKNPVTSLLNHVYEYHKHDKRIGVQRHPHHPETDYTASLITPWPKKKNQSRISEGRNL